MSSRAFCSPATSRSGEERKLAVVLRTAPITSVSTTTAATATAAASSLKRCFLRKGPTGDGPLAGATGWPKGTQAHPEPGTALPAGGGSGSPKAACTAGTGEAT